MNPWLEAQLSEIRDNVRLRVGLWVALGILLLFLSLVISDARDAARQESRQLAQRLAQLERVSGEGNWAARAEEARDGLLALEQGFRRSSSRGLAQAEFESWLQRQARELGLEQLRLNTDDPREIDGLPGYWLVSTELQADLAPQLMYRLLRQLEGHDALTVVTSLVIAERSTRMTMTVEGYYRIDDA